MPDQPPGMRLECREHLHHALRSAVAEEAPMILSRLISEGGAARKERPFIRCQRRLYVARMVAQRLAKFGTIKNSEIGSLSRERRHQMSSIAHESNAGNAFPTVVKRQGMNGPHDGHSVAIGDQCPELGGPTLELICKVF